MANPTDDELEARAVRLEDGRVCSPAQNSCRNGYLLLEAAAMLRAMKGRDTAAFEAGLNTALKCIASIGYGKNQDVDEGHEEAYRAVEAYLKDWTDQ